MISESVENANARIRFFRIAFGAASAGQTVPLDEIRGILADMTRGSRIRFRWEPETGLDRPRIKLAFLILLCFEAVLPFGGEVTVRAEPGRWIAAATAERVTPAPDLWALLADPGAEVDITPAQVQFALVAGAARAAGRPVATAIEEAGISVAF